MYRKIFKQKTGKAGEFLVVGDIQVEEIFMPSIRIDGYIIDSDGTYIDVKDEESKISVGYGVPSKNDVFVLVNNKSMENMEVAIVVSYFKRAELL